MSEVEALVRCRAAIETSPSTYGQDMTGTMGNFFDLRTRAARMRRSKERLADEGVVQRLHQRRISQHGFRRVSVEFEADLCSTGQALDTGTVATKDSVSKVLEAMLGGYQAGGTSASNGSAVASGASTTGVTLTGGHGGARVQPGNVVWVETGVGTGRYQPAKVKTQTVDAITFAIALSFTPAVGAKVLNSQQLFLADQAPSASKFVQFLVEKAQRGTDGIIFSAMGCNGPLSIGWELGKLATWSATFQGAKWLKNSELATPQGGTALAVGTLDGSAPVPIVAGSAVLTPISGTTRTTPVIDKIVLNPGVSWQPVTSHNGVEGIGQMVMVRSEQPTLTMSVLADDTTWDDVLANQTKYQFLAQAGNVGGSQLALECGTMQLLEIPELTAIGGVDYWNLTWGLLEDENCTDQSTDLRRAPFRLPRG